MGPLSPFSLNALKSWLKIRIRNTVEWLESDLLEATVALEALAIIPSSSSRWTSIGKRTSSLSSGFCRSIEIKFMPRSIDAHSTHFRDADGGLPSANVSRPGLRLVDPVIELTAFHLQSVDLAFQCHQQGLVGWGHGSQRYQRLQFQAEATI